MARENRRKREERRFGRPERLADRVNFQGWTGIFVEATNVHDYYRRFMEDRGSLDLKDDIHCARLPFDRVFVEMMCSNLGFRVGWAFENIDPQGELSLGALSGGHSEAEGWSSAVLGVLFLELPGFTESPAAQCILHLDEWGRPAGNPAIRLHERFERVFSAFFVETGKELCGSRLHFAMETLVPVLLALSFMNCKNVSVNRVDPDPALNRERRRAGLKPFLRYHTINIEPMKAVLRTEGNVESEGLKRALHICRGHFATYTEEKPLFGRVAGTFWVPAHVRGTAKQGVVVSDYRVNAPKVTS